MIIRHLNNDQIDRIKWDKKVDRSSNNRMYLLASYLDAVCQDWEALVVGDYEIIMPLPIKRSLLGFKRHFIPLYIQQLGIIGLKKNQGELFSEILVHSATLFSKFVHPLNHENVAFDIKGLKSQSRTNYELDLHKEYKTIRAGYSAHLNRNIQKALAANLQFKAHETWDTLEQFIVDFSNPNDPSPKNIRTIKRIHQINYPGFEPNVYSVLENNEVLAVCLAPKYLNRITLLIPRSSHEGRKKNAMAFLINRIIETFAEKEMVLDFEGSMLPGVANFYLQFGAIDRPYILIAK